MSEVRCMEDGGVERDQEEEKGAKEEEEYEKQAFD